MFYAMRGVLRMILGSENLSNGFRKSKCLTGANNVSEVSERGTGRQMALWSRECALVARRECFSGTLRRESGASVFGVLVKIFFPKP